MGLTNKKEEQLRQQPIIESKVFKSRNGQFIVHQTTITHIKPVAYYEAIIANESTEDEASQQEEFITAAS